MQHPVQVFLRKEKHVLCAFFADVITFDFLFQNCRLFIALASLLQYLHIEQRTMRHSKFLGFILFVVLQVLYHLCLKSSNVYVYRCMHLERIYFRSCLI